MDFLKKSFLLIIFYFTIGCNVALVFKDAPTVEKGVLNLAFWDFDKNGAVNLEGTWEIYWKKIYRPESNASFLPENLSGYHVFPSAWNKTQFGDEISEGYGYATFRTKIILPDDSAKKRKLALRMKEQGTAYELYVDDHLLASRGVVSSTAQSGLPGYGMNTVYFETDKTSIDLVLIVSNYHHRNGGIWNVPVLGNHEQIQYLKYERNSLEFLLGGSILIMSLYHFMLFLFRKNDFTSLYFAFFCFVTLMRVVSTGEIMLVQLIPNIPTEIVTKFEYFSFFIFPSLFFKFLKEIFPDDIPKSLVNISLSIGGLLGMIVCFYSLGVYNYLVDFNYIILLLTIILILFYQIKIILLGRKDAFIVFIFTGILILFTLNDVLNTIKIIDTGEYIQIGVFIFLFGQSAILSRRFSLAFRDIQKISDYLVKLNITYSKFVPKEFLSILKKERITDIQLGDLSKREITILISGIREFTAISQQYSSEEIFDLLNSYYQGVTKIIQLNKGFIDKFIGDEIIVLFPDSPENAIQAAREIFRFLEEFNQKQIIKNRSAIKIGIGIHSGSVTLGTLGGQERMDTTVIGNAVGIARTLESLTKTYFVSCVISSETHSLLENNSKEENREIDHLKLKGQEGYLTIYEFFGGESELIAERKKAIALDYIRALTLFRGGLMDKAKELFLNCQKHLPEDPILTIYVNRSNGSFLGNANSEFTLSDQNSLLAMIIHENLNFGIELDSILKKEKVHTILLTKAKESLSYIQNIKPSLFFVSFNLSDMDGAELIKEIRKDASFSKEKCFIVAIVSDESIKMKSAIYESGADDYIVESNPNLLDLLQTIIKKVDS